MPKTYNPIIRICDACKKHILVTPETNGPTTPTYLFNCGHIVHAFCCDTEDEILTDKEIESISYYTESICGMSASGLKPDEKIVCSVDSGLGFIISNMDVPLPNRLCPICNLDVISDTTAMQYMLMSMSKTKEDIARLIKDEYSNLENFINDYKKEA